MLEIEPSDQRDRIRPSKVAEM